jgi:hypothetical protein
VKQAKHSSFPFPFNNHYYFNYNYRAGNTGKRRKQGKGDGDGKIFLIPRAFKDTTITADLCSSFEEETQQLRSIQKRGFKYDREHASLPVLALNFDDHDRSVAYCNLRDTAAEPELKTLVSELLRIVPGSSALKQCRATLGNEGRMLYNIQTHRENEGEVVPCAYIGHLEMWLRKVLHSKQRNIREHAQSLFGSLQVGYTRNATYRYRKEPTERCIKVAFIGSQYLIAHGGRKRKVIRQMIHRDQTTRCYEICIMLSALLENIGTIFVNPSNSAELYHADTPVFAFDTSAQHAGPGQTKLDQLGYACGRFAFHFMASGTSDDQANVHQLHDGCKAHKVIEMNLGHWGV